MKKMNIYQKYNKRKLTKFLEYYFMMCMKAYVYFMNV